MFVLTEFQVCDKATASRNESGASSHEAYKSRQHERVRMRLFRDKDDPLLPDSAARIRSRALCFRHGSSWRRCHAWMCALALRLPRARAVTDIANVPTTSASAVCEIASTTTSVCATYVDRSCRCRDDDAVRCHRQTSR